MIVKIVYGAGGGYGRSFRGAVRYVASTPEQSPANDRVEFVAVRNLPSEDPEVCWRVMAGHAARRGELMRSAGLASRGSGKGEVAHIVLSWAAEEREGLSKGEMLRAADGALRYLRLDGNQCFIAAHNDTAENPHLHIIASRVDLQTGRLAPAWRSHRRLSRWALEYERSRGEVLLKQRERAWAARDAGIIPPKAKRSTSKDQRSLEKAVERLQEARRRVVLARRRERDPERRAELRATGRTLRAYGLAARSAARSRLELAARGARQRERQAFYTQTLARHDRHRRQLVEEAAIDRRRIAQRRIDAAVANRHQRLDAQREAELTRFYQNEAAPLGRLYNTLAYTDWKAVFLRRLATGERGPSILSRAFTAFSDVGHRRATIDARHDGRVRGLYEDAARMRQRRETRIERWKDERLLRERARYARALGLMERLQEQSAKRLSEAWRIAGEQRKAITATARLATEMTRGLKAVPAPAKAARRAFGGDETSRGDDQGSPLTPSLPRPRRGRRPRRR